MLVWNSQSRWARRIFIAIALSALSCAALLHAQERSSIDCTPSFPFKDSWWGADAAYSIPLPDGRSVWIFGDTLYGDRRVVEGNEPRMVRNSIGVSTCDDQRLESRLRDSARVTRDNPWTSFRRSIRTPGTGRLTDSSTRMTCG